MARKKKITAKEDKAPPEIKNPIRYKLKNQVRISHRGKILKLEIGHTLNDGPLVDQVRRAGGIFEVI